MSVVIIDPATGGVAGLYLDAYKNIPREGSSVLVGAYSSFAESGKRYFYKRTDLALNGRKRFGIMRMPLRYAEMIAGLLRSLLLIARRKPKAVFYALSSNLMPELLFVLTLRLFRIPIYVICHDVVPFVSARENRTLKDLQRRQFYRFANKLVCHNRQSITELTERYGIPAHKLEYLPFPVMDIRDTRPGRDASGISSLTTPRQIHFLFIGHMRVEKGVNLLIRAWEMAAPAIPHASLTIAGQVPPGESIDPVDQIPRLTLLDRYIDEASYVRLIDDADIVVLPYTAGTNSGVLSNVVSMAKPAIVSGIGMFRESGLVGEEAYFETENVTALADKLMKYGASSCEELQAKANAVARLREDRVEAFSAALSSLLDRIDDAPAQ